MARRQIGVVDSVQLGDIGVVDAMLEDAAGLDVVLVVDIVVDEANALVEENYVTSRRDLDVIEVIDVQELLEVVERCLEGTEDVAGVEYDVDDVHHSSDGVIDVFMNFDVVLLLDDDLDGLLMLDVRLQLVLLDDCLDLVGQHDVLLDEHLGHDVLLDCSIVVPLDDFLDDLLVVDGADELHDKIFDDVLDLPGQYDALFFLYEDISLVVDVTLVLPTADEEVALDVDCLDDVSIVGRDVDLLLHKVVDVPDVDTHCCSHCRCQSPSG